ncbi:MAG: hypothetical protein Q9191_005860 [Dirinaria sp. TL-2023a]
MSMLNTTVTKPKPRPKPKPEPPGPPGPEPHPPFSFITCLSKPSFYFIDVLICRPIFDSLLNAPSARVPKLYSTGTKDFGWSPCHITLKKSTGPTAIEISVADIVYTARALVDSCKEHQGAGWAQLQQEQPWYLLVHGDPYNQHLAVPNDAVTSIQSNRKA